ncbi:FecCD family ABC transporter permease [Streptomyces sp. CRN 30]|uniref:FecCD family ABC transporter permease n=1 Tax=Streptomyces sp. CRN 30 TaxID=3075613 RepID=UPI002A8051B5|nr:iron chelate uptake ABC transporter family permease subunit [Streptomyces sp. CRN 30]
MQVPHRGRTAAIALGAVVVLALVCFASVMVGNKNIPPGQVWDALTGRGEAYVTVVVESRYPRTVLGVLVGAGLAVSGVLMQAVTRNPLAEPGLMGINTGAAASVVAASAFLGASGQTQLLLWALPGALLAGVFVHLIGGRGAGSSPARLVLAGAVLTAVLSAFIQAVTLSSPQTFDSYRYWVVGALTGRTFEAVWTVLPLIAVGLVVALSLGRSLNAVALGEESATALGARPARVRAVGLLTAVVLSAGATAAAGPIVFVGLAVPHLVRALVGVGMRRQVLFAALLGPILLLLADVVGRVLVRPQELMVGVVTAFAGAPALLVAVRRMRATK